MTDEGKSFIDRLLDDSDFDEIVILVGKYGAIGFGLLGLLSGVSIGFDGAGIGGAILGLLVGGIVGVLVGGFVGLLAPQVLRFVIIVGPVVLVIAVVVALIKFTWGLGK